MHSHSGTRSREIRGDRLEPAYSATHGPPRSATFGRPPHPAPQRTAPSPVAQRALSGHVRKAMAYEKAQAQHVPSIRMAFLRPPCADWHGASTGWHRKRGDHSSVQTGGGSIKRPCDIRRVSKATSARVSRKAPGAQLIDSSSFGGIRHTPGYGIGRDRHHNLSFTLALPCLTLPYLTLPYLALTWSPYRTLGYLSLPYLTSP